MTLTPMIHRRVCRAPTDTLLLSSLHFSAFSSDGFGALRCGVVPGLGSLDCLICSTRLPQQPPAVQPGPRRTDCPRPGSRPLLRCIPVMFDSPETAAAVAASLRETSFASKKINVHFVEAVYEAPSAGSSLVVPPIERNFLLSPPGSPPLGWTSQPEATPSRGGHAQAVVGLEGLVARLDVVAADGADDGFMLDAEDTGSQSGRDSMATDTDRWSSSNSLRDSNARTRYTLEGSLRSEADAARRGYRVGERTRHVVAFDKEPVGAARDEDYLPLVVVEDHDSEETGRAESNVSLNTSNDSIDSGSSSGASSGDGRGSSLGSVVHKHIPRTALPPMKQ
ncbi:Calcipressin-3 [Entophlyctis luteolus]|nr:Calcipressin-3 [Entophlyctis luteolus]